jgi:putative ABC transport system permease protein
MHTTTLNWQSFSQVTFAFAVTPALLVTGITYALLLGLIGGRCRAGAQPACRSPRACGL